VLAAAGQGPLPGNVVFLSINFQPAGFVGLTLIQLFAIQNRGGHLAHRSAFTLPSSSRGYVRL
jgi:hypothetical protein